MQTHPANAWGYYGCSCDTAESSSIGQSAYPFVSVQFYKEVVLQYHCHVCVSSPVYLHSAVLLPHQKLLNLLTNFKKNWQTIEGLQGIKFQHILWKLAAG